MMFLMRQGNIRNIDLNLLKVLEELLRHQSVTKAADSLGLSQPAVSRALGRLRIAFDDPLFVRYNGRIRPTRLAEGLEERVSGILDETRDIFRPRTFDPAREGGIVRINAPDSATLEILSKVFGRVGRVAPNVEFLVTNSSEHRIAALARNEIDLAIDLFWDLPGEFRRLRLIHDEFVVVGRKGHPLADNAGDMASFLRWRYLRLMTGAGRFLDEKLAELDIQLNYALTVRNFGLAAAAVAETDWLWIVTRNLAKKLSEQHQLSLIDLPISIPGLDLYMIWHKRLHNDPFHSWIRNEIISGGSEDRHELGAEKP